MKIKKELIKAILKQLDKIYPVRVVHQDNIVRNHKDRDKVTDHLFYLKGKGLIEFKDWSSRTKKACGEIRIIIPEGRTYLKKPS